MLPALTTAVRRRGWLPLAVFGFHLLASFVLNAYEAWPPLDLPMHFTGGVAIAYFAWGAVDAFEEYGLLQTSTGLLRSLLVFGLGTTAAVFWEFGEFLVDRIAGAKEQLGLTDTLADMLLGQLGCLTLICFARRAARG
ncbi:MAG: hypothetical protein P1V81_04625 [Planctomycetota bacterium]|nr:hypothetical protein [Planctomycetota bacterium]